MNDIGKELAFLKEFPDFEQRPATITEFLGEEYLNIEKGIRPGLKEILVDIFGTETNGKRISEYRKAIFTGAIGVGKTTFASVVIPYMCHWVLCLKDPQAHYGLLPGSRIAFMQMSTSESQAREVVFGDIFARIGHSKWFQDNFPYDRKFTKQIRFEKDIWVLPGDSKETTFEGYNILGGILDEADSHKVTKDKDYAEDGYNTIESRISSRYKSDGLLIVVGQMKKANGFANRKYDEMQKDSEAYVARQTIWESFGWQDFLAPNGERDSFWYDIRRKVIVPTSAIAMVENKQFLIEIPTVYRPSFESNPEKALRDLAGIPPNVESAFISLVDRVTDCRDKWIERYDGLKTPIGPNPVRPEIADWFTAPDTRKRALHLDLAYSDEGDALGIAMGHVEEIVENDEGEWVPYVVFDMLMRIIAAPGQEILFSEIRSIVYYLRDELGFRIRKVTMDGFQSTDSRQQLQKRRFDVGHLSADKSTLPYHDLREAIYERRLEFPEYVTYMRHGRTDLVEIAVQELLNLQDDGKKIDHPKTGSKDLTDAMACVVCTLMGDRAYRRGAVRAGSMKKRTELEGQAAPRMPEQQNPYGLPSRILQGSGLEGILSGTEALRAPIPPTSFR